jgi:predicted permease
MEPFLRDLRYAVRTLRQSPLFALTVILSIGLGAGGTTTVFAWIDNLVRHPFPAIPDGGALVALNTADRDGHVEGMSPIAWPVLEDWRARLTSFERVSAHAASRVSLREAPGALGEPLWAELVASHFFDTLRVGAALGRTFGDADRAEDAAVVVVSYALWQRRFGGASDILGRSLLFNGAALTVVGVAPPRFGGVVSGLAFDVWIPIWQQPFVLGGADWRRDRQVRRLQAVARLKPGVSLQVARHELLGIALEVSRSDGESPPTGAGARWVSDTQLGSIMGPLGAAMLPITLVVLLSACANVAGLLVARTLSRSRQLAVQVAVGASRRDLVRQALVQSGLLTLLGTAAALAVAWAAKDVLRAFVPRVALPVLLEIDLNARILGFALVVTAAAAGLFAVGPALAESRPDVIATLRAGGVAASGSRARLRRGLVVAQVAFSVVCLSTAMLFVRSIAAASDAPLGFGNPNEVVLVATDLAFTRLEGPARTAVVTRALDEVRAIPGVGHAGFATSVPLSFGRLPVADTRIDGYVPAPDESMRTGRIVVSGGYFEALDLPIVDGRALTAADGQDAQPVAVVNQTFAARYWPGARAVGRRIDQGHGWMVVVGVARDAAYEDLGGPPRPLVYMPYGQQTPDVLTLHVRASKAAGAVVEPIRRALARVHPDLPVLDPGTLADHMGAATVVQSIASAVFGAFGIVALLLSAIGLYGVVAGAVADRRRDIAVSIAMGATPRAAAAAIGGPALRLTLLGLGIGGGLSVGAGLLVRGLLIGVSPVDWASLAATASVLLSVGVLTAIGPAWRAARIDPALALRCE